MSKCSWCKNEHGVLYVDDISSNRFAKYCPKCEKLSIGVIDISLEMNKK